MRGLRRAFSADDKHSTSGGSFMRLIKSLLVATVVATASLAPAGVAQAAELVRFSFVGEASAREFRTSGPNVRVSYRCTSRTREGLVSVKDFETPFRRQARARCDGVPRSVLLRTQPGRNIVLLTQQTAAFAEVVVLGRR
jgi:hypothetical protein